MSFGSTGKMQSAPLTFPQLKEILLFAKLFDGLPQNSNNRDFKANRALQKESGVFEADLT